MNIRVNVHYASISGQPVRCRRRGQRWLAAALCLLVVGAAPVGLGARQVTRSFHLGFTPFPSADSVPARDLTYGHLRDHADLVAHTFQDGVPWNEALASSDYWTYPTGVLFEWLLTFYRDLIFIPMHARYVSLQPMSFNYDGLAPYWGTSPHQPLPPEWQLRRFNHPDVVRAYLNYAIAAVEFFQPTYLAIGIEANILLAKRPDLWLDYKELNAAVYTALKARYPGLVVVTTVQYEHMLGLQGASAALRDAVADIYPGVLESEVRDLLRHSDAIALSTFPHMAGGHVIDAGYYDTAAAIAADLGRPVAIDQSGYTSQNVVVTEGTLVGSESVQAIYVAFLLQWALQRHCLFVVNWLAVDYGDNFGTEPLQMAWAYIGLRRPDGSAKPALAVWDAFRSLTRTGVP